MSTGFIPAHGGYKKLLSYEKAEIVYDATVRFCNRFIDKRSRTHDQISANVIIGADPRHQHLLDRQLRHLEQAFLTKGGLRERMTRARLEERRGRP